MPGLEGFHCSLRLIQVREAGGAGGDELPAAETASVCRAGAREGEDGRPVGPPETPAGTTTDRVPGETTESC